jgi:hypothetical protein
VFGSLDFLSLAMSFDLAGRTVFESQPLTSTQLVQPTSNHFELSYREIEFYLIFDSSSSSSSWDARHQNAYGNSVNKLRIIRLALTSNRKTNVSKWPNELEPTSLVHPKSRLTN